MAGARIWDGSALGLGWGAAREIRSQLLLIGYDSDRAGGRGGRLLVLPLVLCISFFAVADIDSPRRGAIRVHPQNLISLERFLQGH